MSLRTSNSQGLFLVAATVVMLGAAFVASTRAKPPMIYAAGFGLALGIVLRLLADGLNVVRRWPVVLAVALIVGAGFVVSFVPSYQKHAAEWERRRKETPPDPIAAAMLSQASESGSLPVTPPYSIKEYLSQRLPGWSEPWPRAAFGAEWMLSMIVAGACVAITNPRRNNKLHERG